MMAKQMDIIKNIARRNVKTLIDVKGFDETREYIFKLQRCSKKDVGTDWLMAEWMEYYLLEEEMLAVLK